MTPSVEDQALRPPAEGYWAVEIRLADRHAPAPLYLCHAADAAGARRMADRLMGAQRTAHGFSYFRLAPPFTNRASGILPLLGESETVSRDRWPELMRARA